MNTSRIGAEYERAYQRSLEDDHGLRTERSAASHGDFDLTAHDEGFCWHIQCKNDGSSCVAADDLQRQLSRIIPRSCRAMVVHHTERTHFCEHVG